MLRKMKKLIVDSVMTFIGGLLLLLGVYLSYRFYWAYSLILVGALIFGYEIYKLLK